MLDKTAPGNNFLEMNVYCAVVSVYASQECRLLAHDCSCEDCKSDAEVV